MVVGGEGVGRFSKNYKSFVQTTICSVAITADALQPGRAEAEAFYLSSAAVEYREGNGKGCGRGEVERTLLKPRA